MSKSDKSKVTEIVSNFYNSGGWENLTGETEDALRWEDLREVASDYLTICRRKLLKFIPENGDNILDMASGPIQYYEYLEYSENFKKRHCVDFSIEALDVAKKKIGNHGVFHHGDFFKMKFDDNFFDCSLSIHTIYHMEKDKQEEAIRKLIKITKPGANVIIVYSSNPKFISSILTFPYRVIKKMKSLIKAKNHPSSGGDLYFYAHKNIWWNRFSDEAKIQIFPWRTFQTDIQKTFFPNNFIGKFMFKKLINIENIFPKFMARNACYKMIILTKLIK